MADDFVYSKVFESEEEMSEWLASEARRETILLRHQTCLGERLALEARCEELERQNADWRKEAVDQQERYLAEKARVARLEEALRKIADWPVEAEEAPDARSMARELADIARRSLGEEEV